MTTSAHLRRRGTELAMGLLTLALLLPRPAWACGACTDNLVARLGWWATFPLWCLVALVVDAFGFAIYARARRLPTKTERRGLDRLVPWGLVGVGVVLVGAGAGTILPALVVAVALAVRWRRSLERLDALAPPEQLRVKQLRLGLMGVIVLGFAVRALPPFVPTARLIDDLVYWHGGRRLTAENWMEEELRRRQAAPAIEAALSGLPGDDVRMFIGRGSALLRLHAVAGGRAEFRQPFCALYAASRERYQGAMMDVVCAPLEAPQRP